MNAIDFRRVETPASGIYAVPVSPSLEVQGRFVENWGRLAGTFGMGRDLGRVHARLFIANEPVEVVHLSHELGLLPDEVQAHLRSLLDWGVVKVSSEGCPQSYVTARDPWDFFLEIVRQRHRREFLPILELVRETASLARELTSLDGATRARVQAFSKFVEDLSSLIELFVRVGSRPMALALKTVARMAPRA
jgi:DNA-binding transcriptional regulator GbsR (MarR family)